MSSDPCFLRLSVPEVDLLTRAGGPNGWSVRGHYRRLRSGRTVYVKPCVKGPERLAASVPGREYCLEL